MNQRTIQDLERVLSTPSPELLGGPDLAAIHRSGSRRRRGRRAAIAAVTGLSVAAVVGLGVGASRLAAEPRPQAPVASDTTPTPTELSPLAKRVLREIPGAVQVSDWQVVIPGPGTAPDWDEKIEPDRIVAGTSTVGSAYLGVTAFDRGDFPKWLYDEVQRIEEEEFGDENGYPVGSTEMGVLVESGEAELGCVGDSRAKCAITMLTALDSGHYLQWSMGTEDFLDPGADMEVFLDEDYSRGVPATIAIAGIDGTDVARAVFVNTAGETAEGVVEAGTWSEGDSIFWANIPGELATVIAYDAAGNVIEDHPLRPCDSPVDCEVR